MKKYEFLMIMVSVFTTCTCVAQQHTLESPLARHDSSFMYEVHYNGLQLSQLKKFNRATVSDTTVVPDSTSLPLLGPLNVKDSLSNEAQKTKQRAVSAHESRMVRKHSTYEAVRKAYAQKKHRVKTDAPAAQ